MRVGIVRKVPAPEKNPWEEDYTLDDSAFDLTAIINGPECEYHTNGLYYDENGNKQFDPNFRNPNNFIDGYDTPQYPGMNEVFPGLQTATPTPDFYIPSSGEGNNGVPGLVTSAPQGNTQPQNPFDQAFPPLPTPEPADNSPPF
jgi:hypothetical protein